MRPDVLPHGIEDALHRLNTKYTPLQRTLFRRHYVGKDCTGLKSSYMFVDQDALFVHVSSPVSYRSANHFRSKQRE